MPGESCGRLLTTPALLLLTAPAGASSGAETPCASGPFRAVDFWVGEWEVSGADGTFAGRNEITLDQKGCVLVERWRGAQESIGMSMSFYDPVNGQWRQVWVSPSVEIDISGGVVDGSMVLTGTIVYLGEVRAGGFRGTWTPLPDGRVRQYFEETGADGDWRPWFEGFYRRLDG